MKKKSTIVAALTSAAVGGGIATASIAQACGNTPPSGLSSEDIVQSALIALSETAVIPNPTSNQGVIFRTILENLQTNNESDIQNINSINVLTPVSSITINRTENTVVIAANTMTIGVAGGTYETYVNSTNLIFSNITTLGDSLINLMISSDSLVPSTTNSEFVQDTFISLINGLNGVNAPTDVNQLALYEIILQQIQSLEPNSSTTVVSSINLSVPQSQQMQEVRVSPSGSEITINQNILSLNTDGSGVNLFNNSNQNFVISNIFVTGNAISTTSSSVSGLSPVYFANEVITGAARGLNGTGSFNPPSVGTNSFLLYQAFVNAFTDSVDINISAITNISITSLNTFVFTNTSNTVATINPGTMTFTTEGGRITTYSNLNTEIVITGISVNETTGQFASTPVVNNPVGSLIAIPTPGETLLNEARGINGLTSRPPGGVSSAQVLWDALFTAVRIVDTSVTAMTSIILSNPSFDPLFVTGDNVIGILENSIFITTEGGVTTNSFSNLIREVTISTVVITNGIITSVGTISGLEEAPSPTETVRNFGRNLNGITTTPTNSSLNVLYNALVSHINNVDSSVSAITRITIPDPSTVTANITGNSGTLIFNQNNLQIETNSTSIVGYTNSQNNFVLQVTVNNDGDLIQSASSTSTITPSPTNAEVVKNALVSLTTFQGRPPVEAQSERFLYDGLIDAVRIITPGILTLSSISISNITNSIFVNPAGDVATIVARSLTIIGNDGNENRTFNNLTSVVTISNIIVVGDEIADVIGASDITGLGSLQSIGDLAIAAATALTTFTSRPTTDPNARAFWDAILASIMEIDGAVTGLESVAIEDPENNITFNAPTNQLIIAANSMTINYIAYVSPGRFINPNEYVITITENNNLITVADTSENSFVISLLTNSERLGYAWGELIEEAASPTASLSQTAAVLLAAITARINALRTPLTVSLGTGFASTASVPIFSNSAISWIPNSFDYLFFDNQSTLVRATGGSSTVTLNGLSFDESGNLNPIEGSQWINDFVFFEF